MEGEKRNNAGISSEKVDARNDAWRMYLGLPQEHNTFSISNYKPQHSSENKYYFRINDFLERYLEERGYTQEEAIIQLLSSVSNSEEVVMPSSSENHYGPYDRDTGIMGFYTLTKGHDEKGYYISYYDRWNLEGSIEGEDGIIGKPFEIYDRIYYDPKTHQVTK